MATLTTPAAHWKLDEAAGPNNAIDATGNGYTLTQNASPGSGAGKLGTARTLNGSGQDFSSTNSVFITSGISFSVAGWAFFNSVATQPLIGRWDAGNSSVREYLLHLPSASALTFYMTNFGTTLFSVVAPNTIATGQWYYIAAYYNVATNKLGISVNGATPTEAAGPAGYASGSASALYLAALAGSGITMNGSVDSWTFWTNYVLTASDISALYNNGYGMNYPFFVWFPENNKLRSEEVVPAQLDIKRGTWFLPVSTAPPFVWFPMSTPPAIIETVEEFVGRE